MKCPVCGGVARFRRPAFQVVYAYCKNCGWDEEGENGE